LLVKSEERFRNPEWKTTKHAKHELGDFEMQSAQRTEDSDFDSCNLQFPAGTPGGELLSRDLVTLAAYFALSERISGMSCVKTKGGAYAKTIAGHDPARRTWFGK
jgi:hypothetical protein